MLFDVNWCYFMLIDVNWCFFGISVVKSSQWRKWNHSGNRESKLIDCWVLASSRFRHCLCQSPGSANCHPFCPIRQRIIKHHQTTLALKAHIIIHNPLSVLEDSVFERVRKFLLPGFQDAGSPNILWHYLTLESEWCECVVSASLSRVCHLSG